VLFVAGIGLMVASRKQVRLAPAALALMLAALLVAPMLWSALTTFNSSPNVALPYAGPAQQSDLPRVQQGDGQQGDTPQALIEYLVANTEPEPYLVATYNANQAAPFILATGRPVLTFGGFLGSDNIIDADGLAQMVADGELRFVLGGGNMGKQEITSWVQANCKVVQNISGLNTVVNQNAGPGNQQANVLYDCGK
jgi:4-amino-4-deoxy-L-arabinose transferase-like glycosyltransferase